MATTIDPSAIIDASAQIGADCHIGPFCVVGPNVVLRDRVWVQSSVRIDSNTDVGEDVRIFHGASVGNEPQDLKYHGEVAHLIIGARTVIRECATLHRGTEATGKTVVGADCLLMAYTHVAHDCILGEHVILSNTVQIGGHSHVGDWTVVGGITGIHQFVTIGSHCMIGFGYRVVQDVPHYVLAAGEPLRAAGINKTGLERRGFSAEAIAGIQKAYRIMYRQNLKVADAIQKIRDDLAACPEAQAMAEFAANSKRGITR